MTTEDTAAGPPADTPIDEEQGTEYLNKLRDLELAGEVTPLLIGPYSLLVTIGALQLAMRHPGMGPHVRATLREQLDDWRKPFHGTPGAAIIDRGFDPANDAMPRSAAHPPSVRREWACERCNVYLDASAYMRPPSCPRCRGPITLIAAPAT